MLPISRILAKSILFLILGGFNLGFLLASYGILRALRISVNWITWIVGSLIIIISGAMCLAIMRPGLLPSQFRTIGNPIGAVACMVAVYAASQWIGRQWFLRMKGARQWLKQFSKNVLMFLREHHMFFGWVVGAGAIAHMVFFLPSLVRISLYEEITGFIAIGILALIALLGLWLWIETSLRKQRMPRMMHTIHSILAIAFFVVLFLHI